MVGFGRSAHAPLRLAIRLMLSPALLAAQPIDAPGAASRVEVVRVDVAVADGHGRPVRRTVRARSGYWSGR